MYPRTFKEMRTQDLKAEEAAREMSGLKPGPT